MPVDLFKLPLQANLKPNGEDDTFPWYYHPIFGPLYRGRTEQALTLLQPPYGQILEVGFGSGVLMPSLAALSQQLKGIDAISDPGQVAADLKQLGVTADLTQGDLLQTPYQDDQFDLVVGMAVLQYFEQLDPVFQELTRILKTGGHLLVGVPRVDAFMDFLFRMNGFSRSEVLHHSGYQQMIKAAEQSFQLLEIKHFPVVLPRRCGLFYNLLFMKC